MVYEQRMPNFRKETWIVLLKSSANGRGLPMLRSCEKCQPGRCLGDRSSLCGSYRLGHPGVRACKSWRDYFVPLFSSLIGFRKAIPASLRQTDRKRASRLLLRSSQPLSEYLWIYRESRRATGLELSLFRRRTKLSNPVRYPIP